MFAWVCRECHSVRVEGPTRRDGIYDEGYFESNYLRYKEAYVAFARSLLRRLGLPHGLPLLDCGCGAGFTLGVARDLGWTVVGFEPSAAGACVSRQAGHPVVRAAAERLPLRNRAAGGAILLDVLPCVEEPEAVVREVATRLAPGTRLLIKTPRRPSWVYRLATTLPSGLALGVLHLPSQVHAISREGLTRMMEQAGLEDVVVRPISESIPLRRRIAGTPKARLSLVIKLVIEGFYGRRSTLGIGTSPSTFRTAPRRTSRPVAEYGSP